MASVIYGKRILANVFLTKVSWQMYSETLNNEYIGRIYQMSSSQFFNEIYTILRKFQYLRK